MRHRRRIVLALVMGGAGALVVALGRGTGSPDIGPPQMLVAWGFLFGATSGTVVGSLPHRATFPLGFGTVTAVLGGVGLVVVLAGVMHQDLLNADPDELLADALVCAGIGWTIGAAIGAALAADAAPCTSGEAWLIRAAGVGSIPIGIAIARVQGLGAGSWAESQRSLGTLRSVMIADAALVCLTLLLVAGGRHAPASADAAPPKVRSSLVRGAAWAGVALGSIALISLLGSVLVTPWSVELERRAVANRRTATSLSTAAQHYMDRRGSYPGDIETLLAAGAVIQGGSTVTAVVAGPDRICMTVGSTSRSKEADGPFWSAVVTRRSHRVREEGPAARCVGAGEPVSPVPLTG